MQEEGCRETRTSEKEEREGRESQMREVVKYRPARREEGRETLDDFHIFSAFSGV